MFFFFRCVMSIVFFLLLQMQIFAADQPLKASDCFNDEHRPTLTPHVCFFQDPFCNHEEAPPVLILTFTSNAKDNIEQCKKVDPEPDFGSMRALGRCIRATDVLMYGETHFFANCRLIAQIVARGIP